MKVDKKIIIGCDHAGYNMKKYLISELTKQGYDIDDVGTNSTDSVNFADFAKAVAEKVSSTPEAKGILICGTGIGMCIMANKVKGIRAALVHDLFSAKATREHNNSNVLCMGARIISESMALEIAKVWLQTKFLGEKYAKRLEVISNYENSRA